MLEQIKDFIQQPLSDRVGMSEGIAELSRLANDMQVTQTIEPAGLQGVQQADLALPQAT